MRIPITMAHGVPQKKPYVDHVTPEHVEHFDRLISIAREMGFESIDYDQLEAWRDGSGELPERPIMFDFDHPDKVMRYEVFDVLSRHGYRANLFVNTGCLEQMYEEGLPPDGQRKFMTWEELGELVEAGWHIGAHTHTHPNLSEMSVTDPEGEKLRRELETNDRILKERLGVTAKAFAFTTTTWSSVAEREVRKRYRFGRLWITGAFYHVDDRKVRLAEMLGCDLPDEPDGGPPMRVRYITRETNPYQLPSVEFNYLNYELDAFRAYLEGALVDG